jgi:hypothetical protein
MEGGDRLFIQQNMSDMKRLSQTEGQPEGEEDDATD